MKSRSLPRAGSLLLALALAFSLLTLPASADDIQGLSITTGQTQIESGGSTTLTLIGAPTGATISWDNGNSQILSVSPNGASCTVTAGTVTQSSSVTVTATVTKTNDNGTSDSGSASCTVTVNPPPAPTVRITVSPETASVPSGDTIRLT